MDIPLFNLRELSTIMVWTLNGIAARADDRVAISLTAAELRWRTPGVR